MKTIWNALRQEHMIRPVLQLSLTKGLAALAVALLWDRYLNSGAHGLGFGLTAVGLLLVCIAWFSYLMLDKNSYRRLVRREEHRETKIKSADMIDFVDTRPDGYKDLTKDEKHLAHLASSLGMGLLFLIIGTIWGLL